MRPKSVGGRVPLARDVALDVELEPPDLDLAGLGVDLDLGVLGRVGAPLVGGQQRVGQRDSRSSPSSMFWSRAIWLRASRKSKFAMVSLPPRARDAARRRRLGAGAPREDRARALDARRAAPGVAPGARVVDRHARLVGVEHDALEAPRRLGAAPLAQRDDLAARAGEVRRGAQPALEPGARDVQGVAPGDRVVRVQPGRDGAAGLGEGVEVDPAGAGHGDAERPAGQLEVVEVEAEPGQQGAQGGLEVHSRSFRPRRQGAGQKKRGPWGPRRSVLTSLADCANSLAGTAPRHNRASRLPASRRGREPEAPRAPRAPAAATRPGRGPGRRCG